VVAAAAVERVGGGVDTAQAAVQVRLRASRHAGAGLTERFVAHALAPTDAAVVRVTLERPAQPIAELGADRAFAGAVETHSPAGAALSALPTVSGVSIEGDALAATGDLIAQNAAASPVRAGLIRAALCEALAAMQARRGEHDAGVAAELLALWADAGCPTAGATLTVGAGASGVGGAATASPAPAAGASGVGGARAATPAARASGDRGARATAARAACAAGDCGARATAARAACAASDYGARATAARGAIACGEVRAAAPERGSDRHEQSAERREPMTRDALRAAPLSNGKLG
jgi:hypothetical protein